MVARTSLAVGALATCLCSGCVGDPPPLSDTSVTQGTADTSSGTTAPTDPTIATNTTEGTTGGSAGVELGNAPCVVVPDESALDYVVGDPTNVTCRLPADPEGSGEFPEGLELNANTCTVTGTSTETRAGTWVFIVEVVLDAEVFHVPHCAPKFTGGGAHDVDVVLDGRSMKQFTPAVVSFSPGQGYSFGSETNPVFTVTDPVFCDPMACFWGYTFQMTTSPLEPSDVSLEPAADVFDAMMVRVGFEHHLQFSGTAVPAALEDRPWVVDFKFDYCIRDTSICNTPAAIEANGNGRLQYGIIMQPTP